jgi:hypothetical protein
MAGRMRLPVCVLCWILRNTPARHINVREDNVSRVSHQGVPLWAVSELEV